MYRLKTREFDKLTAKNHANELKNSEVFLAKICKILTFWAFYLKIDITNSRILLCQNKTENISRHMIIE